MPPEGSAAPAASQSPSPSPSSGPSDFGDDAEEVPPRTSKLQVKPARGRLQSPVTLRVRLRHMSSWSWPSLAILLLLVLPSARLPHIFNGIPFSDITRSSSPFFLIVPLLTSGALRRLRAAAAVAARRRRGPAAADAAGALRRPRCCWRSAPSLHSAGGWRPLWFRGLLSHWRSSAVLTRRRAGVRMKNLFFRGGVTRFDGTI